MWLLPKETDHIFFLASCKQCASIWSLSYSNENFEKIVLSFFFLYKTAIIVQMKENEDTNKMSKFVWF